ncbi:MAG: chromosome segregation ATPase [Planctomycetota bacterium]|jgi:chromosome segregation ATPase
MNRVHWNLLLVALMTLGACQTQEDAADEEFYFAEAKGEYGLALSYLKRAQYAREKQVEYLELAEEQEEQLRNLRAEIAQRRGDNDKRAKQVQGLKTEATVLSKELATFGKTKADIIEAKAKVFGELVAEKAAITKLEAEIAEVRAKRKQLEEEKMALQKAFGVLPEAAAEKTESGK